MTAPPPSGPSAYQVGGSADPAALALERARAALERTQPQEALRALDSVLRDNPGASEAWCLRALALLQVDEESDGRAGEATQQAMTAVSQAVALRPQDEWPHRLASLVLLRLGQPEESVRAAWRAVELAPQQAWPRVRLAYSTSALRGPRRPQAGREAYDHALEAVALAPLDPVTHLAVADIARTLGWLRQSRAAYRQALALDPASTTARHNLAVLDLTSGDAEQALSGFSAAVAANPRLDASRVGVEAGVWRLLLTLTQRLMLLTVAVLVVLATTTGSGTSRPSLTGRLAVLPLLVLAGVLAWRTWGDVPPTVRPYLRTMLRRGRGLQVSSALVVVAVVLLAVATLGVLSTVLTTDTGAAAAAWGLLAAFLALLVAGVAARRTTARRRR